MRKTRRLLDQISANTKDQFYSDAASILSQMNAFIINHENDTFPKDAALIQGMYTAINANLKNYREQQVFYEINSLKMKK